jgi:Fur family ferric uptake transcriptional regulator
MPISERQMAAPMPPGIQVRIAEAGLRRTLATRAVVGLFVASPQRGLNHAQAHGLLTARGLKINRVTLYRLLERLSACGVLSRYSDDIERTWCFRLANFDRDNSSNSAPSFECDTCHQQFRLANALAPTQAAAFQLYRVLAELGHQGLRMDIEIHGTCAGCIQMSDGDVKL